MKSIWAGAKQFGACFSGDNNHGYLSTQSKKKRRDVTKRSVQLFFAKVRTIFDFTQKKQKYLHFFNITLLHFYHAGRLALQNAGGVFFQKVVVVGSH